MELSILDALAQSKPKEPEAKETDKRNINNGFACISDTIFKDILVDCGCDKETINDCFEMYDESARDFLAGYFEHKCEVEK